MPLNKGRIMEIGIRRGSAEFKYGISTVEQLTEWLQENQDIRGVSFVGRSNVGKSSTINSLFGKQTARVSKTPGRTREINIFEFELQGIEHDKPFYLFDLPGYGFAEVSREMSNNWQVLMNSFFQHISQDVLMLNLQDARHPHQQSDQEFQSYLKNFDFETFLIFNKIDKLKKQKERAALDKLKPTIFKEYKWVKQIHFVSAEKKTKLEQLEQAIVNYLLAQ
tara:strand:- start:12018 stop:12683 length:666 start_codon:yes stop_codon:yes gene_type:complete